MDECAVCGKPENDSRHFSVEECPRSKQNGWPCPEPSKHHAFAPEYDRIECDECHGTGNFPIVKDGRGEFEDCEKCFGHGDILVKREAKALPPP